VQERIDKLSPRKLPKPKKQLSLIPSAPKGRDLNAMCAHLDMLIQLVQLGGLHGFSTADDPTMQALVKSRNEHIRAASNCLIMAKQAIKAAMA